MCINYDEAMSELSSKELSMRALLDLLGSVSGETTLSSCDNIYLLNNGNVN